MYNSVIGYAFKIIKGNMFFSAIMFIIISQLMVINSIFSLVWKYEILIQSELVSFFRIFSIYSLFIFIFIAAFLLAAIISVYIFSKNSRMFSTLRIFGSTKLAVRKLYTILSLLYALISFLICVIEIAILYIRYNKAILEIIEMPDIFSGAFLIFCANIVLILIFMFGAFIINSILLKRNPYEDLRGTL